MNLYVASNTREWKRSVHEQAQRIIITIWLEFLDPKPYCGADQNSGRKWRVNVLWPDDRGRPMRPVIGIFMIWTQILFAIPGRYEHHSIIYFYYLGHARVLVVLASGTCLCSQFVTGTTRFHESIRISVLKTQLRCSPVMQPLFEYWCFMPALLHQTMG